MVVTVNSLKNAAKNIGNVAKYQDKDVCCCYNPIYLFYSKKNCKLSCSPLSPAIAKILALGLQRYNSPGNWARKLFKPPTDSASRLVEIEKKFRFGLGLSGGDVTSGGVISVFLAYFTRPWTSIQWANLFAQVFFRN